MKKLKQGTGNTFFTFLFSFFICTCNLFNPSEDDYWEKIEEEIRWANAARLDVSFHAPEGWINSSAPSLNLTPIARNVLDIREGFEFTVECEPSAAFGFERWIVFLTSDYHDPAIVDREKSAFEMQEHCRIGGEVTLVNEQENGGNRRATFRIDTDVPLTIVPWCSERPRVVQSNPPLNNSGLPFPRGQEIKIIFSQELAYTNNAAVPFGEGYIQISGMQISDSELLNGHGDLTGQTYPFIKYFDDPVYEDSIITINPLPDNLPPANIMITVTVGTNIEGTNGKGLAEPVSFFYTTDDRLNVRTYYANNVWALHPEHDPETQFFYQIADRERDRRIRKNPATEEYEVTLYFNVIASSDEMAALPDTIDIVELEYANLMGNEMYDNIGREPAGSGMKITDPSSMIMGAAGAGAFYRTANPAANPARTEYYQLTYSWGTRPPSPGIHRLAILPYRTGTNPVEPASLNAAVSRSQYVTVVYDNQPPGGEASFGITGQASFAGGVYNFNDEARVISLTPDFATITDNNGEGVTLARATSNLPWTMDAPNNLYWQFRIVTGTVANHTSAWFPLSDNQKEIDLPAIGLSSSVLPRAMQIKYQDSLGNESPEWLPMASIRYYNSARGVRALHNPATATADDFIYQGAPLERDRRLRGTSPNYSVTLYFYLPANTATPDMLRVAEIDYAALQGSDSNTLIRQRDIDFEEAGTTGADGLYRTGVDSPEGASYYRADYTWNADNPAGRGIVRLAVMPYINTDGFNDTWQAAVAEGRFVTVVLDNLAPGGGHSFSLSGEEMRDENVYVYNNNTAHRNLTLSANFSGITDNAGTGIALAGATQDKPWTMESEDTLQWRWRIVRGTTADFTGTWAELSTSQRTQTLSLVSYTTTRNIQVQYRDSLGNESAWLPTYQQIRYSTGINAVSTWSAECNGDGNTVTLTWARPSGMTGVEVMVDGVVRQRNTAANATTGATYTFTVPEYDTTGIRRGEMQQAAAYRISLMAYSNNGNAAPVEFTIWNIPGMFINQSNTVLLTQSNFTSANLTATGIVNYVLTQDITLSNWDQVNLTNRKFYGNGHTITINAVNTSYRGIFYTVTGAEIRDLRVHYAGDFTFTVSSNYNIGGLAASVTGTTTIRNIIVSSAANHTLAASADGGTSMGGIAGVVNGNGNIIENCYSDLNIRLTGTGTSATINVGGIIGRLGDTTTQTNPTTATTNTSLSGIIAKGNVEATGPHIVIVGGLAGAAKTNGTITDVSVSGIVALKNSATNNTTTSVSLCGGIIGYLILAPQLNDCYFYGMLDFDNAGVNAIGRSFIGGLVGNIGGSLTNNNWAGHNAISISINRCFVRGDIQVIDNTSNVLYFGGISGYTVSAIDRMVSFIDCAYLEGTITVRKIRGNGVQAGGFVGDVVTNTSFENCRVVASSMTVSTPGGDIGGFAGVIRGDINGCYTNFPLEIEFVSSTSQNDCHVGGFIGRYVSNITGQNWIMRECYAGGSVTVTGAGRYVYTGGLIGRMGGNDLPNGHGPNVSLRNSYATGNVFASSTNTTTGTINPFVYAGGLVGYMRISGSYGNPSRTRAVENCFAAGSVTAQSSNANATVYAGGLVGNRDASGFIRNNAVLGSYVLVKQGETAPASTSLGRVTGNTIGTGIASDNYAADTTLLRTAPYDATSNFTARTPSNSATGKDGQTVTATAFYNPFIWTNNLQFNNTQLGTDVWRMNQVITDGHPLLANVGGQ